MSAPLLEPVGAVGCTGEAVGSTSGDEGSRVGEGVGLIDGLGIVGGGVGLGVPKRALGIGFSGQLKAWFRRRPGFRAKFFVVVSTNVSNSGNEKAVEGQTDGTPCSHVQSVGPSTLLVMGSSRKSGVTSTGSLIPERKIATASVSLVAAPVFKESR
jgi:hypothetical protein